MNTLRNTSFNLDSSLLPAFSESRNWRRIVSFTLAIAVFAFGNPTARGEAATQAQEEIRQQILKQFPQADTDKDGVVSEAEEALVRRQILKRFSRADTNGDGALSDAEMKVVLRQAAKRANRKTPNSGNSETAKPKNPGAGAILTSLGLKYELDIEYKKNSAQQRNKLDVIYPKRRVYEKAPLFIYIHGGGNTGGTKSAIYNKSALTVKELTAAGIAVASIDYRVFGQGEELGFHQLFQDCKDAVRFLAKNSDRFGIDPHKMVTWGTSAGGSKALICALTANDFLPGEVSGAGTEHTVLGSISFYGVTTFLVPELWEKRLERFPSRSQSKGEMMFKPSDGMSTDEIKRLVSADQHLKANSPPILLVHGDTDPTVPIE
ncbi:MAG: alpha/beta hydrolase fold domain-containing protein, partial [Planctomycetota bacterium]